MSEMTRDEVIFSERTWASDSMPENLISAIGWLVEKLASIPEEFRESATVEIEAEADYALLNF